MHYDHVSLYETAFSDRTLDVEYFCSLARGDKEKPEESTVLEYGAGAGRVTLPLLKQGQAVTAVEKSPSMHARLTERVRGLAPEESARATLILGDMKEVSLEERFSLVLATFNVIAHLQTHRDLAAFLRRAKQHLRPNGRLVFDSLLPHPDEVHADPSERYEVPPFEDADTGELMHQTERYEYDPFKQTLLVESEYRKDGQKESFRVPLVLRQWFPKEIEAILSYEGFTDVRTYADYTDLPGAAAENALIFSVRAGDPNSASESSGQATS